MSQETIEQLRERVEQLESMIANKISHSHAACADCSWIMKDFNDRMAALKSKNAELEKERDRLKDENINLHKGDLTRITTLFGRPISEWVNDKQELDRLKAANLSLEKETERLVIDNARYHRNECADCHTLSEMVDIKRQKLELCEAANLKLEKERGELNNYIRIQDEHKVKLLATNLELVMVEAKMREALKKITLGGHVDESHESAAVCAIHSLINVETLARQALSTPQPSISKKVMAVVEAAKVVVEKTTSPCMDDPFNNGWRWRYRLEDALDKLNGGVK